MNLIKNTFILYNFQFVETVFLKSKKCHYCNLDKHKIYIAIVQ